MLMTSVREDLKQPFLISGLKALGLICYQVTSCSMFWVFRKKHGWVTLLFLLTVVFTILFLWHAFDFVFVVSIGIPIIYIFIIIMLLFISSS